MTKRVELALKDCFGNNVHLPTGGAEKEYMIKRFTSRRHEGVYVVIDCSGVQVVPSTATTSAGLRHVLKGKDKDLSIRFQVACDMVGRIRHVSHIKECRVFTSLSLSALTRIQYSGAASLPTTHFRTA